MGKKTKLATVGQESNAFYADTRQILEQARNQARSAINSAMVEAYWLIGKRIVEEQQLGKKKAKYGERLLENLSKVLNNEFGRGFSYANLRNFRQFYFTYPDDLKRGEDDNPTIGIILCDSKDETIVKHSVLKENRQLFASKYQQILPSEEELIAKFEREKRLIEGVE